MLQREYRIRRKHEKERDPVEKDTLYDMQNEQKTETYIEILPSLKIDKANGDITVTGLTTDHASIQG